MSRRPIPRKATEVGGRSPIRLEEAELVEKVKSGETEAYETLVRRYQDRVFNACWRISGHLEDARDLTQETFLRAFEGIAGFRHQSSFYTWLFRVAVNLALSHRRKASRRSMVSLDEPVSGTQAEGLTRDVPARDGEAPDSAVESAELRRRLATALQGLDKEHRAVLVLRDIEGFSYQDIAEVLEISLGTVKSRVFRARTALRDAVDRSGQD